MQLRADTFQKEKLLIVPESQWRFINRTPLLVLEDVVREFHTHQHRDKIPHDLRGGILLNAHPFQSRLHDIQHLHCETRVHKPLFKK